VEPWHGVVAVEVVEAGDNPPPDDRVPVGPAAIAVSVVEGGVPGGPAFADCELAGAADGVGDRDGPDAPKLVGEAPVGVSVVVVVGPGCADCACGR
jgi:hypothetical protein